MQYSRPRINFVIYGALVLASHISSTLGQLDQEAFQLAAQRSVGANSHRLHSAHQIGRPSGPGGSHLANGGKIFGTPTYYSGDSAMGTRAAAGPGGSHLANGGKIYGTPTNSGSGANKLADPPGWNGSYRPSYPGNGSSGGGKHLANGGYISSSRPTGYGRPVFFSKSLRFPIPTQLGDFNVEVGMKVYAPDNGNDLVIDQPEMITGGRPSGVSRRPDPADWARTTMSYPGGQSKKPTGFNPHSTTFIPVVKFSSPTGRPCPTKPLGVRETKCQKEGREVQEAMCRDNIVGRNIPSCKSNGDYDMVQYRGSGKFCADRDGKEVQGSATNIGSALNCSEFVDSDGTARIKVVSRLPNNVQSTAPPKYLTGYNPNAQG